MPVKKKKRTFTKAHIAKMQAGRRKWLKAQKKAKSNAPLRAELEEAITTPRRVSSKIVVMVVDADKVGEVLKGLS